MSSTKSLVAYHDRMEYNNDIVVDNEMVDSTSTLPYETNQEKAIHGPTAHNKNINVINIQLPYDLQAPTEPEL